MKIYLVFTTLIKHGYHVTYRLSIDQKQVHICSRYVQLNVKMISHVSWSQSGYKYCPQGAIDTRTLFKEGSRQSGESCMLLQVINRWLYSYMNNLNNNSPDPTYLGTNNLGRSIVLQDQVSRQGEEIRYLGPQSLLLLQRRKGTFPGN